MIITNEEILKWKVVDPSTNENIVYIKTKENVVIADMVREEEKNIRVKRLVGSKRKCAFNQSELELLHGDRKNGMSIRILAIKYNKSTRTIQKYLKIKSLL